MNVEFINYLELSIHRALWGEVIPSLRLVLLKYFSDQHLACIYFYHHGPVTDNIEDHYSCIHTEVEADFVFDPRIDFKIIRCDYPNPIPKEKYIIYCRKEPFVDPK